MNTLDALQLIRTAAAGTARMADRDVASLEDLVQHHRGVGGILAARQEFRAVLPSVKRLRDACERLIAELEEWPG